MKKRVFLTMALIFVSISCYAQCAMCRAVLESDAGQATAKGINDGIVYLMAIPYILATSIGVIIYLKYFRNKKNLT